MNISCNVALDLMPLVKDNIASEESKNLLKLHITHCESCNNTYNPSITTSITEKDSGKKFLKNIKKQIRLFIIGIFIICLVCCSFVTFNSFQLNVYLMPILGIIGGLTFKKKWYITPLLIFIITAVVMIINNFLNSSNSLIIVPLILSVFYSILSLLTCIILILIKYIFKNEKR